jgi:hypothetical protein
MRKLLKVLSIVISVSAIANQANAYEDEEVGYDTLVKELSGSSSTGYGDLLGDVEIHFGAGFSNSMFVVIPSGASTIYANQRSVAATLGIDLFSKHWLAEGDFINFIERQYDAYQIRLKEFDLKVVYKNRLDGSIGFRIGAGLAARYMTISTPDAESTYTTPFSVISGGLETYVTKAFSLGIEVATRNTMTYETPDQSALDLAFRFDGHF